APHVPAFPAAAVRAQALPRAHPRRLRPPRNPAAAGNPAPGLADGARLRRPGAAASPREASDDRGSQPHAGQLFRLRRQQCQPGSARTSSMKVIAACEAHGLCNSDSQLKAIIGEFLAKPPRRVDRLTLLALLVAAPLKAHLQADSGLYLAATYPARANMFALLNSVCAQH